MSLGSKRSSSQRVPRGALGARAWRAALRRAAPARRTQREHRKRSAPRRAALRAWPSALRGAARAHAGRQQSGSVARAARPGSQRARARSGARLPARHRQRGLRAHGAAARLRKPSSTPAPGGKPRAPSGNRASRVLDYTELRGQLLFREADLETFRAEDLARLPAARRFPIELAARRDCGARSDPRVLGRDALGCSVTSSCFACSRRGRATKSPKSTKTFGCPEACRGTHMPDRMRKPSPSRASCMRLSATRRRQTSPCEVGIL